MKNENVNGILKINNLPSYELDGFVVVRCDNATLWYFGMYDTYERAFEVAMSLGNGLVVEVRN